MQLSHIAAGKDAPKDINVVIEVPMGASPVKYELDKESGAIFVDRFLSTAMFYPCNYGFIPQTLSGDGDPADVLVVSELPVTPGSVLRARPIGVLLMEDEAGEDEKILAVPHSKLTKRFAHIQSYKDLPEGMTEQIEHFFEHYKDLEKGKFVKVTGWKDVDMAESMIQAALERAENKQAA